MRGSRFVPIWLFILFSSSVYSDTPVSPTRNDIDSNTGLSMIVKAGEVDGLNTVGKRVKLPSKTFILSRENSFVFRFPYECRISQYKEDWIACLLPVASKNTLFAVLTSGALPSIDIFKLNWDNISAIRNAQNREQFISEIKNTTRKYTFENIDATIGFNSIFPTSFELIEVDGDSCLFFLDPQSHSKGVFFFRCDMAIGKLFNEFQLSDYFCKYCPDDIKRVLAPMEEVFPVSLNLNWKEFSNERINIQGNIIDKAKIAGLFYRFKGSVSRENTFSTIKESLVLAEVLKIAAERSGIKATPLLVKEEMEKKSFRLSVTDREKLDKICSGAGLKSFNDYIQIIGNDKNIQEIFAISKYLEPQISSIKLSSDELEAYFKENQEEIKKQFNYPEKNEQLSPDCIILNFFSKSEKINKNSLEELKAKLVDDKSISIQQLLTNYDMAFENNADKYMHQSDLKKWHKSSFSNNIFVGDAHDCDGKEILQLLIVGDWQEFYYDYASKMLLRIKINKKIREIVETEKSKISISIDNPTVKDEPVRNAIFDKPSQKNPHIELEDTKKKSNEPIKEIFNDSELKAIFISTEAPQFKDSYQEALFCERNGDYAKAVHSLVKSVNEDNNFRAAYKLGEYYKYGRKGIPKNSSVGNDWFKKTVANIEKQNGQTPETLWMLGRNYKEGFPKETHSKKVFELFKEASKQNFAPALTSLAECYFDGYGVRQNTDEAVKLLKIAVSNDDGHAMALMGSLYLSGSPQYSDIKEGLTLIKKSVLKHDPVGQYCLGLVYSQGIGINKSLENAKFWFQKAADQGYSRAIEMLDKASK